MEEEIHKIIDGEKVYLDSQEKQELIEQWKIEEELQNIRIKEYEKVIDLEKKYGHIPTFLEKLCNYLKIDVSQL